MKIILECEDAVYIDSKDFKVIYNELHELREKYDAIVEIKNFKINYNNKEEG